mgnify:CR=1 FL=1
MKAVNRFLRRQVTLSCINDFQMAIESNQTKVNLLKPDQNLQELESLPLYKIIQMPTAGIVYQNAQQEKRFMRFNEIAKYSDGTLKVIALQLRNQLEILNKDYNQIVPVKCFTIENALEVVEDHLDYRCTIQRCKTYFGLRKSTYSGRKRT